MHAVSMDQVSKTFGRHRAVDSLTLSVPVDAIYGFIGPNGSGKTTTLRMILHIIHPDEGRIQIMGKSGIRAANDWIGYLPEERGLYRKMTVERLLLYYASIKGMDRRRARTEMDGWLACMGLEEWKRRRIEVLSKGMAQKVQFIATVITKPRLLVLDEPFSGLDPVNLEVIREAIVELRAQGTTIIFSTHDMAMAERLCDFVFMIHKGRKVLDGSLETVQSTYALDTIRVRVDGGRQCLSRLAGVESIRDMGQVQELRFSGDSQALLRQLAFKTTVHSFEVTRPSLHDIFLRIADPERKDGHEKDTENRAYRVSQRNPQ